ncbi:MAG: bifunctional nuclease family protein [Anaerolineaceae bacterium]
MIECFIESVRVSLTNQDRIVVLKDQQSTRYLPIWIGIYESEAITIALQSIVVARPLTHDLLKSVIEILDGKLIGMEITAIENETFYSNLIIETSGVRKHVDCRPSDALALVVRCQVPIYVDEEVFERAGIFPEDFTVLAEPDAEERTDVKLDLSAFDDFLSELGKKNKPDEPTPQDPNR